MAGSVPDLQLETQQHYRLIHDIYVLLNDGDRRVLDTFDLTISQYAVLTSLDTQEGRRLTSLSDKLLRSKSTITRIIDYLEEKGYVERVGDPEDRRAQRVILTRRGVEYRALVAQAHSVSLERRFDTLDSAEQMQLKLLLRKLCDGLRDDLGSPENGS
jgi:MarR family 2-MHQ and catechol resistance regulon transcriptional repressor